ncbi:putative alpha-1,2-mannosidase [Chitinophaga skermanii]|uniref:Putative alpha-1,2-mannosidase n=1 Tax=Chitinophaga skermanii TaxID=331697 RepID=A0A327QKY0_9BACT|nr:GH92 family glycosyl hydrolase [Chitinophaga skermanii]RAJ02407.1 putative alpha-1,2-mannosidase [Chitinophaga skermanii]
MKKLIVVFISTLSIWSPALAQQPKSASKQNNLAFVDPTIGNVGHLLEPTRPTVQLPNQVIRFSPIRKDYIDDQIASFPLCIVSHRLGQVFSLHPTTQPVQAKSWQYKYTYDHDLEINQPHYYQTYLIDDEITVAFTPGKKAGFFTFDFPAKQQPSILFTTYNDGPASFTFNGNTVQALETYHGNVKVYMYGEFSVKGTPGVLQNGTIQQQNTTSGEFAKAYYSFPANTRKVDFKYAISYISAEQAKKNFNNELHGTDFAMLKNKAQKAWDNVLSQIQVEGGTLAQKRAFYTSLYRSYERMINISEDGKYFSGFDNKIHEDARPFYTDDWTWDSFLAHHPLRMILQPEQEGDMLQSFVRMYEQSGWLPTFPVLFGDHACMNGFHSSVVVLDAYRKGIKNFDISAAYDGMHKNSTQATMLPWRNGPKTKLEDFYYQHGYYPALHPNEQETEPTVHSFEKRQSVAVTLGTSYDDWALSQLAKELNKPASDVALFEKKSTFYKNLWHEEQQLFMPKDDKGNWIDIDPKFAGGMGGRDYYDENNGWTYLWSVQQDIPSLVQLLGGQQPFEAKLDQLFREGLDRSKYEYWAKFPDATGNVGQYSMGNEPSFHIPYLYNFTGSPWKTQKRIRFLLDTWFKDNVFGIPGDEDGGGMTAFVVFSSMGFYPVTPGLPVYTIGSPVFSKVSIKLSNGKTFTVTAKNSSTVNKYIQSAKINGQPLQTPWFTHEQLVNGGHLELEMGPKPNKQWGTGTSNLQVQHSLANTQIKH